MNGWFFVCVVGGTLVSLGWYYLLMKMNQKSLLKGLHAYIDENLASNQFDELMLKRKKRRYNKQIDRVRQAWWGKSKKKAIRYFCVAFLISIAVSLLQYAIACILKEDGIKLCAGIIYYIIGVIIYAMIRWRKRRGIWIALAFLVGPMIGFVILLLYLSCEFIKFYWIFVADYVVLILYLASGLSMESYEDLGKKVDIMERKIEKTY